MEQNREPRNGPSSLWSTNLQQSRKNIQQKKRWSLQQMVLGKLESHMQKNGTGALSYTVHKDKLKMDERPKWETGIHQNPRGEHKQQLFLPQLQQLLARHVSRGKGNKGKNELLGLHQDKKLLYSEGHS